MVQLRLDPVAEHRAVVLPVRVHGPVDAIAPVVLEEALYHVRRRVVVEVVRQVPDAQLIPGLLRKHGERGGLEEGEPDRVVAPPPRVLEPDEHADPVRDGEQERVERHKANAARRLRPPGVPEPVLCHRLHDQRLDPLLPRLPVADGHGEPASVRLQVDELADGLGDGRDGRRVDPGHAPQGPRHAVRPQGEKRAAPVLRNPEREQVLVVQGRGPTVVKVGLLPGVVHVLQGPEVRVRHDEKVPGHGRDVGDALVVVGRHGRVPVLLVEGGQVRGDDHRPARATDPLDRLRLVRHSLSAPPGLARLHDAHR